MRTRHADRLWMGAGAAVIVVLALVSWFFLISPKYAEADEIRGQADTAQIQIAKLRKTLSDLQEAEKNLPQARQELKRFEAALPADARVSDFVRQVQSAGDAADVAVDAINVNTPTLVDGSTTVYSLPMTLTADGTAANLGSFLRQLQQIQPRAVLVESANLTAQGTDGLSLNLSVEAFVAVPAGAAAPTVIAD